jgi:hypothetical protein
MGWEREPVNSVRVHAKIEQTTKMSKISRWLNEVTSRSILASSYALSAIASPVFLRAKQRFKELLKDNFQYVDGMTPEQINARLRVVGGVEFFVEDDLEAQDRQTTLSIINVEFEIYKLLGVDQTFLEFYKLCHINWRWKGHGIYGAWNAMRLTGQVTTALGNAITNLIVHNRFCMRNQLYIKLTMFLGDDIIFLSSRELDVRQHGTETKELYNMISKITQRKHVGGFLSMIVHNLGDFIEMCPWFNRTRHRFSVSNYTHLGAEGMDKHKNRCLSYCFTLGGIKQSMQIAKEINPDVSIPNWYNVSGAVEANALYENCHPAMVENNISTLCHMMRELKIHNYQAKVYSNKR